MLYSIEVQSPLPADGDGLNDARHQYDCTCSELALAQRNYNVNVSAKLTLDVEIEALEAKRKQLVAAMGPLVRALSAAQTEAMLSAQTLRGEPVRPRCTALHCTALLSATCGDSWMGCEATKYCPGQGCLVGNVVCSLFSSTGLLFARMPRKVLSLIFEYSESVDLVIWCVQ